MRNRVPWPAAAAIISAVSSGRCPIAGGAVRPACSPCGAGAGIAVGQPAPAAWRLRVTLQAGCGCPAAAGAHAAQPPGSITAYRRRQRRR